jgi:hypothetical protein
MLKLWVFFEKVGCGFFGNPAIGVEIFQGKATFLKEYLQGAEPEKTEVIRQLKALGLLNQGPVLWGHIGKVSGFKDKNTARREQVAKLLKGGERSIEMREDIAVVDNAKVAIKACF